MVSIIGYINVYRNGYYHRKAKPNAFDRQVGDIYPSLQSALGEIAPGSYYIGTAEITWNEESRPHTNPPESVTAQVKHSNQIDQLDRKTGETNAKESITIKILRALQKPS